MADSREKLHQLFEWVRQDRGDVGSMVRPLLSAPFVRGYVRDLLDRPADELDELIAQVIGFLAPMMSDPPDDETGAPPDDQPA